MLQTKLYLELKFSSMLDIYLRHCFKIVFEIFHVMGRWPLFQINYIDIDWLYLKLSTKCSNIKSTSMKISDLSVNSQKTLKWLFTVDCQ